MKASKVKQAVESLMSLLLDRFIKSSYLCCYRLFFPPGTLTGILVDLTRNNGNLRCNYGPSRLFELPLDVLLAGSRYPLEDADPSLLIR